MNLFTNDIRENISINKFTWLLFLVCLCTLFLFLGDTLFNTRGEPREAVVALSMLKEGNWVLPSTMVLIWPISPLSSTGWWRCARCP